MPEPLVIALGFAGLLGLGLLVWRRNAGWLPALTAAVSPALLVVVAWGWWADLEIDPVMAPWDGVRLAPSLALRQGWAIYPPVDRGPVLGWIYGPVAALFYVPATLAGEPWAMILAGRSLSLIGFFGPVAWLLGREARRGRLSIATAVLLVGGFAILADGSPALRYASTAILADNPAIGLGAIALGLLNVPEGVPSPKRLAWAMLAASLAVWSKQPAFPVVAIVGGWAWRIHGGRAAFRLALIPIAVSGGILVIFGGREIALNLLMVPARHPWHTAGFRHVVPALVRAYRPDAWVLAVLVVGWFARDRGLSIRLASWSPFLLGGTLALPIASAGYLKVGGDVNSLAHAVYPLAVAGVLLVGDGLARSRVRGALLLGLVSLLAWGRVDSLSGLLVPQSRSWREESRQVVQALRTTPGAIYFPCHPLEHLAVDRRPFHQEYGVFDRDLAGFPLTSEHLRAGIPPNARRLAYPAGRTYAGYYMRLALPEFRVERRDPTLPGAACYDRDDGSSNVTEPSPSTT